MAKAKEKQSIVSGTPKSRPALTPEARENQIISLAVDLAEQQIRDGTASSQVITHFLKIGCTTQRIEKEILKEQKKLIEAKTQALQALPKMEALFQNAISAMKEYGGQGDSGDSDDY